MRKEYLYAYFKAFLRIRKFIISCCNRRNLVVPPVRKYNTETGSISFLIHLKKRQTHSEGTTKSSCTVRGIRIRVTVQRSSFNFNVKSIKQTCLVVPPEKKCNTETGNISFLVHLKKC